MPVKSTIFEFGEKQKEWDEWVQSRPLAVQDLCNRFPPNKLYRLKTSNHRVTIYSYSEDGTLTVNVSGNYNLVAFERSVFGIKPDDLEECELPAPDEPRGSMGMDPAEIKQRLKRP